MFAHAASPNPANQNIAEVTLQVGAMTRSFLLYTPPTLPIGSPLLIVFHPSNSSAVKMRSMIGETIERMAREHGFAVAYPDGFEGHFNDCRREASYSARTQHVDDIGFTRSLIDTLVREHSIDHVRVFAIGYSNGAQMVLRLALEAPALVAGVVAISANLPTAENNDCTASRDGQPSVSLIEGTDDRLNPYKGGRVSILGFGNRGTVMSAIGSAKWFAQRYRITETGPTESQSKGDLRAELQTWGDGQIPKVQLITIVGGGHTIPQAAFDAQTRLLGKTFRSDFPLTASLEIMWLR